VNEFKQHLIDQMFIFIAMEGLNGVHYDRSVDPTCKLTRYTSPDAMFTIYESPGHVHSVGLSVGSSTIWVLMESDDTERLQGLMDKLSEERK
jgi:hypothetical protein